MAEAKSKEKVAKAQLKANYEPSKKSQYNLSAAKAEADYSVDKEKCDTCADATKSTCINEKAPTTRMVLLQISSNSAKAVIALLGRQPRSGCFHE